MAKGKKLVDALMSGVKTPAQMKAEMAVGRARNVEPAPAVEQTSEFRPTQAGDTVGGYLVREDIPDKSSIGASLENYKSLGLREVPMSAFSVRGKPEYYSKSTREYTQNLANQISQNKELNPLIVVKDKEGYYVLEGGHRFDALRELDAQSFPALVVEDLDGMARGGIIKMGKGGLGRKLSDKLLPKVEAPSVMTRSEITDLADYIKNREGGYGLRRVERAADEIPRLGDMYTQDALRSAFSGDNARALMTMNPADFEKYSRPLEPMLTTVSGGTGKYDMSTDDYVKYLQSVGRFDDVPYFMINKQQLGTDEIPYIAGHEGRNRSRALSAAGNEAGLVVLNPRAGLREPFPRRSQEDYIEALKKEFSITGNRIRPETYFDNSLQEDIRRPAIDMPDLYAKGGAVKMAEGGEADQAEIDRMRLELNNSPVIQATPQTPFQRGIGTLGGYMDRAGQFVSKSIEPLAETHPVKHFLADMFLAGSLKSAGTALQDYTGTEREADEDNPVRGVISKDWKNLNTSKEPLLDPRMLDVMGFTQPVARLGIKGVRAGAKAATPFAKDVGEMASEMYMRGDISGMPSPNMYAVSPDGKPSKVLAPASDIGFYSPTEAAALNLQRKSGSGQAFLNDIMKGENVKSDEISAMGLDTFLKDKKNVTAEEVRDYIAQNKIQLGESRYTDELDVQAHDRAKKAFQDYSRELGDKYGINPHQNISMYATMKGIPKEEIARYEELQHNWLMTKQPSTTKYASYALPGGENYREIVLTLEPKPISEAEARSVAGEAAWNVMSQEQRAKFMSGTRESDKRNAYKSSHWDEPNPLAHLRVSDRVTDGKKTLLVDEVQSDWHQAGREQGYKNDIDMPSMSADELLMDYGDKLSSGQKDYLKDFTARWDRAEKEGNTNRMDNLSTEYQSWANRQKIAGVPDAPYKDDWYQLTLRRAIKEAIDGGYDRVALPTGALVADRFDLSKKITGVSYQKMKDGQYSVRVQPKGEGEFVNVGTFEADLLPDVVGKEMTQKIIAGEGQRAGSTGIRTFSGLDLRVGGEGMKKYYDEIYPSYLKKLGKKYGAQSGMTKVDVDGNPEPLHYMEITPAMRKEFSTGIHMKSGGKVQFAKSLDAMRHELTKAK